MPLPIAHGLLGASLVAAIHPEPTRWRYAPLLVGALLANAPDFDFLLVFLLDSKEWHRSFTHSILFAVCIWMLFLCLFGKSRFREATAFGAAYASHCFLDFATTTQGGVRLLLPFSDHPFALRWIGLSEMPSQMNILELLKALSIELLLFMPLLVLILFLRKIFEERKKLKTGII